MAELSAPMALGGRTHPTGGFMPKHSLADLELPEIRLMPTTHHDSDFYGASSLAAAYCGFSEPPTSPRGYWMHGWGPKQFLAFDSPILYFGPVDLKGKRDYHWV